MAGESPLQGFTHTLLFQQICLNSSVRRKLHFNTADHVNNPQVLVTWEQKKQAGEQLQFMLCIKTNIKPPPLPRLAASLSHRTEGIPNELFKALSHLSWIWGPAKKRATASGQQWGNHWLGVPRKKPCTFPSLQHNTWFLPHSPSQRSKMSKITKHEAERNKSHCAICRAEFW